MRTLSANRLVSEYLAPVYRRKGHVNRVRECVNAWRLTLAFVSMCSFVACSGATTVLSPGPLGPVTWFANVGASSTDSALQGLSYYPTSMTINVGDTIAWTIASTEPHTITLLGAGQTQPPPPGPTSLAPAGGTTYDGTVFTSSGLSPRTTVYKLTFTAIGTFKVYCLIHQPEMFETVTVQAANSAYPNTQAQYQAQGAAKSVADLANAGASLLTFPFTIGGTQVAAGISPGLVGAAPSDATVLRFINGTSTANSTVTVPVGGSVTWYNESNNVPHTVTFGVAGQPFPVLNPFGPKLGGSSYDGTTTTSSGVLPPVPGLNQYTLTFTKAGTYQYRCLIHDDDSFMIGTVVVQ